MRLMSSSPVSNRVPGPDPAPGGSTVRLRKTPYATCRLQAAIVGLSQPYLFMAACSSRRQHAQTQSTITVDPTVQSSATACTTTAHTPVLPTPCLSPSAQTVTNTHKTTHCNHQHVPHRSQLPTGSRPAPSKAPQPLVDTETSHQMHTNTLRRNTQHAQTCCRLSTRLVKRQTPAPRYSRNGSTTHRDNTHNTDTGHHTQEYFGGNKHGRHLSHKQQLTGAASNTHVDGLQQPVWCRQEGCMHNVRLCAQEATRPNRFKLHASALLVSYNMRLHHRPKQSTPQFTR